MKVNIENLRKLVDQGLLTCREHDTEDLLIWNYTKKCQFEQMWLPETLNCRGLITRADGLIVERPFKKFFNLEEHELTGGSIPEADPLVFEKMDGSLGIMYPTVTGWAIATRGSFNSDQAKKATEILRTKYRNFEPAAGYTFLFEIVYPKNRIVVDYGEIEDLYFLCAIDRATGVQVHDSHVTGVPMPYAERHGFMNPDQVNALDLEGKEGVVLYWPDVDLRLKVKTEDYKRKHSYLTRMSNRIVWGAVAEGTFDELVEMAPDEIMRWLSDTADAFRRNHDEVEDLIRSVCEDVQDLGRKEAAEIVLEKAKPISKLVFASMDGKLTDRMIWEYVYPLEHKTPFSDSEAADEQEF